MDVPLANWVLEHIKKYPYWSNILAGISQHWIVEEKYVLEILMIIK